MLARSHQVALRAAQSSTRTLARTAVASLSQRAFTAGTASLSPLPRRLTPLRSSPSPSRSLATMAEQNQGAKLIDGNAIAACAPVPAVLRARVR